METKVAAAAVLLGGAVAVALAPWGGPPGAAVATFAFLWIPQAVVLGVAALLRPRAAALAGIAAALTLHLVAFRAWIQHVPPRDALAWLYYPFAHPGALAGAVAAALLARSRPSWPAAAVAAGAAALTAVGLALGHAATVATRGFGL